MSGICNPSERSSHSSRIVALRISRTVMKKRGQASSHDGDALALTFAQVVTPAEVEEEDDEDVIGGCGIDGQGAWMR
jgi:hypothetical protein